jgi:hypothetical protein
MPSEHSEGFFGIEVPDMEYAFKETAKHADSESDFIKVFDEATMGLLIYRIWQLLVRTDAGRVILLEENAKVVTSSEVAAEHNRDSFSHICCALLSQLMCRRMPAFLKECTLRLPLDESPRYDALTPEEQKRVIDAIDNPGTIDWHMMP